MSKDIAAKLKRLEIIFRWMTDAKHEYFMAKDLAKECRVSGRSILRDIALLKEVGIGLDAYHGTYYIDNRFSLEKLGFTPQTAATLCIAYEVAKQAGEAFAPACQHVRQLFSPNKPLYEINPILPPDPIISKLQKAIKEKRYIKIVLDNKQKYVKPYCLIQSQGNVFLIFAESRPRQSVRGYVLEFLAVKWIEDVTFEAKSHRVKNGRFSSLGVPKYRINEFIRDHF